MIVKSPEELDLLVHSGQILAATLKRLGETAKAGISLKFLDQLAFQSITQSGAEPAFRGYRPAGAKKPFPASLCTSVSESVVHGRPIEYRLKEGDLLKLDLGVNYRGFFTDAALTIGIGRITAQAEKLIKTAAAALEAAIKAAVLGRTLGDIGFAIRSTVEKAGFKVIKELTGHGVGRKVHESPTVYNYGEKGHGLKLEKGMVLAIEPIISAGSGRLKQLPDDSYVTADGSLAAHFEHTVVITENGPKVLTQLL